MKFVSSKVPNYNIIGYLGSVDAGKSFDATELVASYEGPKVPILIDQVRLYSSRDYFLLI